MCAGCVRGVNGRGDVIATIYHRATSRDVIIELRGPELGRHHGRARRNGSVLRHGRVLHGEPRPTRGQFSVVRAVLITFVRWSSNSLPRDTAKSPNPSINIPSLLVSTRSHYGMWIDSERQPTPLQACSLLCFIIVCNIQVLTLLMCVVCNLCYAGSGQQRMRSAHAAYT